MFLPIRSLQKVQNPSFKLSPAENGQKQTDPAPAAAGLLTDCPDSITLMFPHLICLKYSFLSERSRRADAST